MHAPCGRMGQTTTGWRNPWRSVKTSQLPLTKSKSACLLSAWTSTVLPWMPRKSSRPPLLRSRPPRPRRRPTAQALSRARTPAPRSARLLPPPQRRPLNRSVRGRWLQRPLPWLPRRLLLLQRRRLPCPPVLWPPRRPSVLQLPFPKILRPRPLRRPRLRCRTCSPVTAR